jgi:lipoprotein NlpD
MITFRRVAVCTMLSLWLAGCTNNNSTSAPISSVGGGGSAASGNAGNAASQQGIITEGRIVYNRSYDVYP